MAKKGGETFLYLSFFAPLAAALCAASAADLLQLSEADAHPALNSRSTTAPNKILCPEKLFIVNQTRSCQTHQAHGSSPHAKAWNSASGDVMCNLRICKCWLARPFPQQEPERRSNA